MLTTSSSAESQANSHGSQKHPQHFVFLLERFAFVSSLADAFAAGFAPENGGSAPAGMFWKAGVCIGTAAAPGAMATGDPPLMLVTTKLALAAAGDGTNPEPG